MQTERCLARKVRRARGSAHLFGKVADTDKHESDGVAVSLNKFQVVSGVPPAAGSIHGGARGHEITDDQIVAVELRRIVNGGVLVI
jgi:hypothetical protein